MCPKWCRARSIACFVVFAMAAARPVAAETLSLAWDTSAASGVAGYVVYISIQPGGVQATAYDVGNTTSFEWTGAVDGQQYYFSVAAYSPGPVLGPRSAEISRYPNFAPTLSDPGSQSSTKDAPAALQLTGSDPEGAALTYGASGLPPGLQLMPGTGYISGVPTSSGSYMVTATVTDGWLSDAKTFSWSVGISGGSSTTPPSSGNLAPVLNNPGSYTTTAGTSVGLQLLASDPEGAPLTYGANGLPPGLQVNAGTGTISGVPSTPGTYVVTATVSDGALSDAETFTWSVVQSSSDNVAPALTITVPTTGSTYTTENPFITIGGTAWDDRRIALIEWISDKMGNGVASGTDNWLASVPLVNGVNTITIRARDDAGNASTKSIIVKTKIQSASPGTGGKGKGKGPR